MDYFKPLEPLTEQNQILQSHVHPPDWENPEPAGRYHLVVVGAGTAGLVAAAGAAGLGAKVALIERGLMGGDCLNVGCVPSKALISSARRIDSIRRATEYGATVENLQVGFSEIMERMRRLRAGISPHDSASRFRDLGVDVFFGQASFCKDQQVSVVSPSGDRELSFRRAVIATGGRAAVPDIPGLKESGYLTNETVFSLTTLPSHLIVIGGGPIGCELAQAFARFGSRVSLINRGNQILPKENPDAARIVKERMERDGVELLLGAELVRIKSEGTDNENTVKEVTFRQQGEEKTITGDQILLAVGRTPNCEGLGLDQVGVSFDIQTGVQVNDYLQTTNPHIYAAGDICSKYKFTHAADFMARTVIQNALFPGRSSARKLIIPRCTYTSPEVAQVGTTPAEAERDGTKVSTFTQPLDGVDRAILDGQEDGFVEIYCEAGTDKIIGATIVAEHAGDLISEVTLAMQHGLGLGKIASTIHPYPTQAEAIRKLGDQYNRTRLSPFVKKLFGWWFKWTA